MHIPSKNVLDEWMRQTDGTKRRLLSLCGDGLIRMAVTEQASLTKDKSNHLADRIVQCLSDRVLTRVYKGWAHSDHVLPNECKPSVYMKAHVYCLYLYNRPACGMMVEHIMETANIPFENANYFISK